MLAHCCVMKNENSAVFPSAVDRWIGMLLLTVPVVLVGVTVVVALTHPEALWVMLIACAIVAGFGYFLVWPVTYTVTDTALTIRSGKWTTKVPTETIVSVTPTRNPLSSPALSLSRLKVVYGDDDWILISPKDREEFLHALGQAAGLERDGDELSAGR